MRIVAFLFIALILVSVVFAEESVLIDFSELTADTDLTGNDGVNDENQATLIDFSSKAGSSFTEEEKEFMRASLAIPNWEVELASSSRRIVNQAKSYIRPAPVKQEDWIHEDYRGRTVLGARIHFPVESFNSYAIIKPPFKIPAYEPIDENDLVGVKFDSRGVVKNIGVLKSISISVLGRNFPNGIGVILKDQNNQEKIFFLDTIDFDGWKVLTWNNPNYVADVKKRDLKKVPLYPKSYPYYGLAGIIVYRDSTQIGGDVVTYVKDIKLTYDKAVVELQSDIDDEALWLILNERESARRAYEFERLGTLQLLRYLETRKLHVDTAQ